MAANLVPRHARSHVAPPRAWRNHVSRWRAGGNVAYERCRANRQLLPLGGGVRFGDVQSSASFSAPDATPATDLSVKLGRLSLRNPILTASGTFGYAREMEPLVDFTRLGG